MTVCPSTVEVNGRGDERDAFSLVNTWIFDLDDTLYPQSIGLHDQLKRRVVCFIADYMKIDRAAAETVHLDYYERFGATLHGLVELHGVAPLSFLDFVHDVDLSALSRNDELIAALRVLPGKRVIFTNSSRRHAEAVLEAMGMVDLFDATFSIEDGDFIGKPQRRAYERFLDAHGIDARSSAMFEDRVGNLVVPHELGMRTILLVEPLVGTDAVLNPEHVDAVIENLAAFLNDVTACR
jgi:putative hydrolase of the HAD superfamily